MSDGPGHTRRLLRWAIRVSGIVAALLVVVSLAVYSGYPQAWAVSWAGRAYLDAIVDVEWARTVSPATIARLRVYPDAGARSDGQPLVVAEDIAITYALNPGDGRWIREVTVGSVHIHADASDPDRPNYGFLQELLAQREREEPADTRFWPQRIVLERVALEAQLPDAYVSVSGLEASARLDTADRQSADIRGPSAELAWWVTAPEYRQRVTGAAISATGGLENLRAAWNVYAGIPGLLQATVNGSGDFNAETPEVDVRLDEAWIAGGLLRDYAAPIVPPVYFDDLRVSQARLDATLADPPVFSVAGAARARGLALPRAEEPLYADAVVIELRADGAAEYSGEASAEFAEGQRMVFRANGTMERGHFTAAIDRWSKEELVSVLPAAFRESVAGLGFGVFSANGEARWEADTYTVQARAESSGGEATAAPISWRLDAEGSRTEDAPIEGEFEARLGDRLVQATGEYVDEDHYKAEARIEQVEMAPWLRFGMGPDVAGGVRGTIEGTVEAHVEGADAPMEIRPNLTIRDFAYETVALDRVDVTGSARYDMADKHVTVDELRADTVDGLTYASLRDWHYDIPAGEGAGSLDISADLGIVARVIELPDLYGSGSVRGDATFADARFEYVFTFHSDFLSYGEVLMPLGTELTGEGVLRYDVDVGVGTVPSLSAAMGEGTRMQLTELRYARDPLSVDGMLAFDSDLQLLVGMEWLEQAEGTLRERTTFFVSDEGLEADWDLELAASTLVLPEDAGFAEAVYFEGEGRYRNGLSGSGRVRAKRVSAGGGSVWDAEGPARFEGNRMRLDPIVGTMFGGTIEADADIGVLEPGLPIFLTANFDRVDLALLTEEVQPPNTRLTGRAQGSLAVDYTIDGLRGFTVDAEAPDGLTVNRSLVADLLQSERLLAGMGERVAERAMDKLLGEKPQRPFDRGRLYVYQVADTIQGLAELESVKTADYHGLNLTVNLDMDVSALAEGLRLLEESTLADVEF